MEFYIPEFEIDLFEPKDDFFNINTKKKSPLNIEINGKEFSEFNSLRLSYAIDSGCAAFSFDTIFNPSKGLSNDIKPFGNESIKIIYKGEYVFIGILEKITTGYSNSGSNINIQGRSKSGILLDTQVKGSQLANSTIEGLSQTFGFTEIKEKTKTIFPLFDWNSGDNAFDILSKYAAQKGLWAVPRFDGSLEFINFNKLTDPKISIQDGKENVLSITATYDVTKRFSEYVGFKKGFAQKIVTDNTISNRGKKYFRGDDNNSDLDKVAQLGRSKSISESMTFSVVLSTWEWDNKLFQPGILLNVTSPMNLIYKESKFCVKQVDYTYDINSGYITELQLCLPSVFTLENPDLEFFKTFEDLSLKDKGLLKQILGIPNNELYKTSLEYFKK
jgi:prophage tail gpP-like protein